MSFFHVSVSDFSHVHLIQLKSIVFHSKGKELPDPDFERFFGGEREVDLDFPESRVCSFASLLIKDALGGLTLADGMLKLSKSFSPSLESDFS